MRFVVHTFEDGPVFVKVASLPYDQQPYLAFSSCAVAARFCVVASISGAKVVRLEGAHSYDQSRGLLLFQTEAEVECYGVTPSEFRLEELIVPFSHE